MSITIPNVNVRGGTSPTDLEHVYWSDHDGHCHCGLGHRPCDCDPAHDQRTQPMPAEACTDLGVDPARVPINGRRTISPLGWVCIGYTTALLGTVALVHACASTPGVAP